MIKPLLAILIPTTPDRAPLFERLINELRRQTVGHENEVMIISWLTEKGPSKKEPLNSGPTTGEKRNDLIENAIDIGAQYIAFHDDDDLPGPTYIQRGLEVAHSGMDAGELWGQIYWSGKPGKPFHHFLSCTHAYEDDKYYYRPINHLNFMRLDKVKNFKFQNKTFGEDMTWAMEIRESGVLRSMYSITEVIYNYYCGEPKHAL